MSTMQEKFKEYWHKHKAEVEKQKLVNKFADDFYQIMSEAGIYTASYKTFKLHLVEYKDYGFVCQIYNPLGLEFSQLEVAIGKIEDGIGCTFIVKRKKRKSFIFAKVVIDDVVSDIRYNAEQLFVEEKTVITEKERDEILKNGNSEQVVVEVDENVIYKTFKRRRIKPFEFFIGYDASGHPVVINMVHFAHIMITGSTRSGKSKLLDCILTSLIYHNTPQELELYLFQIAKNDLGLYKKYKQVRGYAKTLEEAIELLEHIKGEMDRRSELIAPMHEAGLGNNILEFNKRYSQLRMTFVHVVFDEMSSLIDIEGEDDDVKKKKKKIIKYVSEITQYGGSLGINGVFSLQRATHDKLPPFAKANCNLVISFKQNNEKSSEVAIGDSQLALGLEQREIVYRTTDYDYAKVPLIDDRLVVKTLEKWADKNHRMYVYGEKKEEPKNKKGKNKDGDSKQERIEENALAMMAKTMEMMVKVQEQTAMSLVHKETTVTMPEMTLPSVSQTFDKVMPNVVTKKTLEENVSKINGYVPYNPLNPNRTIHDQTTIDNTKTQKPIKTNKEKAK